MKKTSGAILAKKTYLHISLYGFILWDNFEINNTREWRQVKSSFIYVVKHINDVLAVKGKYNRVSLGKSNIKQ